MLPETARRRLLGHSLFRHAKEVKMDEQAKILIVGGGIWGLSTAYHLARSGETDIQVLERNQEPCGETTYQASSLVGQIRSTPLLRRAIRYAIDLLTGFEEQTGYDPG